MNRASQAVLFASQTDGECQPSEQQSHASPTPLRPDDDSQEPQGVLSMNTGQEAPPEVDGTQAAAAQDWLLRAVTILDALEAEQRLMVSAALKPPRQEPTPSGAKEALPLLKSRTALTTPTKRLL